MKLTVVGCSPAWPNAGSAQSGYLVTGGGGRVLLDCGPGVLARLRETQSWPEIDAIVITHLHLDHCGDLVPWLWGHVLGPVAGTPGPELHVPPAGLARVSTFAPLRYFLEVFDVHEYAPNVAFAAADYRITPFPVEHYGEPAFGMRVEHDGKTFAYTGDTGPSPALADLARDADALLCEATLVRPESGARGHMTAEEARATSEAAGVRRLLLTHRASEHPVPELVHDGFELEL